MRAPEIQQEIERTRERLGETVEELAAKADVKARARDKVAGVKAKTKGKAAELSRRARQSQVVQRRWPLAVAAGVLIAGSVAVWRRRKT
jgi:succinyl-CoA synthetase beta subunit